MKCRISKAHVMVYRAVEGAVRNTGDGHPKWHLSDVMAQSIAKRATGTLTASWPEVLAAKTTPSEAYDPELGGHWPPRPTTGRGKGGRRDSRRSPLHKLHNRIGNWVGTAKRSKDYARAQALIEVLREIDSMEKKL